MPLPNYVYGDRRLIQLAWFTCGFTTCFSKTYSSWCKAVPLRFGCVYIELLIRRWHCSSWGLSIPLSIWEWSQWRSTPFDAMVVCEYSPGCKVLQRTWQRNYLPQTANYRLTIRLTVALYIIVFVRLLVFGHNFLQVKTVNKGLAMFSRVCASGHYKIPCHLSKRVAFVGHPNCQND